MPQSLKSAEISSPPPYFSSSEIVIGIVSGNKKFESVLVKQYFKGLLFILNKRANNIDLASDIAQETFLVVIQKARKNQIEKPEALKAFIRQVGINLLLAYFRKESRQATSTDEHIDLTAIDNSIEHFKRLNDAKLLLQVTKFIREMPTHRDRVILQNYFVYEKSKVQICLDLNISSAHFDRVLFRSRNRLKKIVQSHFPELNDSAKEKINTLLTVFFAISIATQIPNNFTKINNLMRDNMSSKHSIEIQTNLTIGVAYFRYPLLPLQASV